MLGLGSELRIKIGPKNNSITIINATLYTYICKYKIELISQNPKTLKLLVQ